MFYAVSAKTCIIKAKVNPSQRSADNPHLAWVALNRRDGVILAAHCECMAGLGETCSHVAAIFFKLEAAHRLGYTRESCTSEPCQWNQSFNKKVQPAAIIDIDFKRPKCGKVGPDVHVVSSEKSTPRTKPANDKFQPTVSEVEHFFQALKETNDRITVLSTIPEFCEDYAQEPEINPNLPTPLTNLPNVTNEDGLKNCYEKYKHDITKEECDFLEKSTVKQAGCKLWFEHRRGRITASNMYNVVHTNQDRPSNSVVQTIFSEKKLCFKSSATEWGTNHEDQARTSYADYNSKVHQNFVCEPSGLVINSDMPHLAASPDGWISCDCCGRGTGVLEIKCPYKYRDMDPAECQKVTENDKSFCLDYSNGVSHACLKTDHKYYLQVQTQMFVTGVSYCDFVVWTKKGFIIVKVKLDAELMKNVLLSSTQFFYKVLTLFA